VRGSRWVAALSFVLLLIAPTISRAEGMHSLTLSKALRALSVPTIPPEWAGIWTFADTTRDCDSGNITDTNAGTDTLCSGQQFGADTTNFTCDGTVTSTTFDFTCSGSIQIDPCTVNFTNHFQGTRTGSTVRTRSTFTTQYSPPGCLPIADSCTITTGTETFVGSEPPDCAMTPVRKSSWGRLKLLYR
jgi:hypothetical protein